MLLVHKNIMQVQALDKRYTWALTQRSSSQHLKGRSIRSEYWRSLKTSKKLKTSYEWSPDTNSNISSQSWLHTRRGKKKDTQATEVESGQRMCENSKELCKYKYRTVQPWAEESRQSTNLDEHQTFLLERFIYCWSQLCIGAEWTGCWWKWDH